MSPVVLCQNCHEREVEARYRPFCSERCKMVDLGRWLSGDYRIAAEPADTDHLGEVDSDEDDPRLR